MTRFLIRAALICTSTLWWIALSGLILLTLVVVGLRVTVNFSLQSPDRLASWLSTEHSQVEIASSEVDWNLLIPTIRVKGFTLNTKSVNVTVEALTLKPRIIPSIVHLRPIFDSSEVNSAQLDFYIRDDDDEEDFDFEAAFAILLIFSSSGNFNITDSTMVFHDVHGNKLPVFVRYLTNAHNNEHWWIDANLNIGDFIPDLDFTMINRGSFPQTIEELDFDLRLRTSSLVIPKNFLIPDSAVEISAAAAAGSLRFNGDAFEQFRISLSRLRYKQQPVNGLSANVMLWPREGTKGLNSDEWQGYIPDIRHGGERLITNLYLSDGSSNDTKQLFVSAKSIQAERIMRVLRPLRTEFAGLNLSGEMRDIKGLIPLDDPIHSHFTAQISQGGISLLESPFLDISKLSTKLEFQQGMLKADLDTPLQVTMGEYYDEPWDLDHIRGKLKIDFSDPSRVGLSLRDARLRLDQLSAKADLRAYAPINKTDGTDDAREDMLQLSLTLDKSPIDYKDRFIPYKLLGKEMKQRLQPMLQGGNLWGDARLRVGDNPDDIDYQLGIRFADTSLRPLAGKPAIRNISGDLKFANELLTVRGSGLLGEAKLDMHQLEFDLEKKLAHLRLGARAKVDTISQLASRFLENDKLSLPPDLEITNPVSIGANLSIPFEEPEALDYLVNLEMYNNQVLLAGLRDFPLTIEEGELSMDNQGIKQNRKLRARWHGQPIELKINSTNPLAGDNLEVTTNFPLPAELMNTLVGLNKQLFTGKGDLRGRVEFNPTSLRLINSNLDIDLDEMELHLPEGWGKPAGQALATNINYSANDESGGLVTFHLPGYARGRVEVKDDTTPLRGWIGLGFSALKEPPNPPRLELLARLTKFDLFVWRNWWDGLKPFRSKLSDAIQRMNTREEPPPTSAAPPQSQTTVQEAPSLPTPETPTTGTQKPGLATQLALPGLLERVHIALVANDIVLGDGVTLNKLNTSASFANNAWLFTIDSEQVAGSAEIRTTPGATHIIALDKLLIPEFKADDKKEEKDQQKTQPKKEEKEEAVEQPPGATQPVKKAPDPLAELDMTRMDNIDFSIKRLAYGVNELGKWNWRMRATNNAARLEGLEASYKNASLFGEAEWKRVENGNTQTSLNFTITGSKIKKLVELIDANQGRMTMYMEWPGSPAAFDLPQARGNLGIKFTDGRVNLDAPALGLLNFLGLLNINTIGRRLSLDFSDQGGDIAYSRAAGDFSLKDGKVTNVTPFIFSGPVVSFSLQGYADLITKKLEQDMVIRISVGEALPLAVYLLGSTPQTAVSLYLGNLLFGSPISALTSARYAIRGTTDKPEFEMVQLLGAGFPEPENKQAQKTQEDEATAGEEEQ